MTDYQRCGEAVAGASVLLKSFSSDSVTITAVNELEFTYETLGQVRDYVAGLERALSEYVVLGAGKCTISKAHADMGRAALAAKP